MKQKNYNIPTVVYFVVTALLIAYFFPREGKFRYQFYEGKPWRYGLLTAPSDFPIYKTDDEVKAEKDSVLRKFEPYYRMNPDIQKQEVEKLRANYNNGNNLRSKVSPAYMQYIESSLINLYKNGIISSQDLDELRKEEYSRVNLLENAVAQPRYVSDFFTVRTAYEFIINNCPPRLDKSILQSCDINNYLTENISYAADMSDKIKEDMLQSVSIANGMVQAGERIVDRGEIIDNHTYNVLRSLKAIHEAKTGGTQTQGIILAGQFVLVFGLMFCFWLYLWSFRLKIFHNRKNVLFLILCIFVSCILTELCVTYALFNVYILPFAIVPIVVRTFFDSRTALFTHLIIVLICSLMVPFPHEFLLLQIVAGMVVTFSLKELSERSQLIRCAVFIFISYAACYLSLTLYQEANLNKINWMMMLYFGINFILLMFTYVLVYMLEKTFGYVSSITLVELSNINNPILKKLSETCPGTFQHSITVGNLGAEIANKIGAQAQLVRTGALYHDIGKMENAVYFTENQAGFNPHDQLSDTESAAIIIGHVTEGLRLAEEHHLPQVIRDFIATHHGTGLTRYFYIKYTNEHPDEEVDESLFRYSGPNPFTREQAILMICDTVEAASRSLKEYSPESISALVDSIIQSQVREGFFNDCPITFRDLQTAKNVLIGRLKSIYHTRISYPELSEEARKKVEEKKEEEEKKREELTEQVTEGTEKKEEDNV